MKDSTADVRKDIRMDVRFRNNCILSKMESVGVESVAELARKIGITVQPIHRLVGMTEVPLDKKGNWRPAVLKMCEFFKCAPEELFSSGQMETKLQTNRASVEVSFEGIRTMLEHEQSELPSLENAVARDQIAGLIDKALGHLKPRQQLVLTKRFGLHGEEEHTLEQVAGVMGVTKERVRQIEAKALRTLRRKGILSPRQYVEDAQELQNDL